MPMQQFFDAVDRVQQHIRETQADAIRAAAATVAESLAQGGAWYIMDTGHMLQHEAITRRVGASGESRWSRSWSCPFTQTTWSLRRRMQGVPPSASRRSPAPLRPSSWAAAARQSLQWQAAPRIGGPETRNSTAPHWHRRRASGFGLGVIRVFHVHETARLAVFVLAGRSGPDPPVRKQACVLD